jgi:hypothetical protein
MNNLYRSLPWGVLFTVFFYQNAHACGFDFVGSCASAVRFTANGASKDYFVTTCAYGNSFTGNSIGTNLTTLQLSSTTTVTWESCTNILQESNAFIRVFNNPSNKGAFQKVVMSQQSINTNSPPYRTRTYSNNLSIDLLAGLSPNTTYTVEMYYQIGVDSDGNGSVDDTKVYDNNGAYFAANFQTGNISVQPSFPIVLTTQSPACNGGNGSATVSASGGVAPYTFSWSNGATGANITGLRAGNYSVTATDAASARTVQSFFISEPSPVSVALATTQPSCGSVNGAIGATPSGGTSPFSFLWSNNATTASISTLQAGIYALTVTDSKGCKGSATATLIENCGGNGTYCTSAGAPWSEWVARVQFNTIDNASVKTRPDRFVAGYSDWTDVATTVSQGASYPLSITPGLSWTGQQTNLYFRAWIDFNRNGIFEDTEKVLEKNATSLAVSNTVNVPATATVGPTVMRISMKKDSYATACEAFAAGEVEDYAIVIGGGNTSTCTTDVIKPVLSACPPNIGLISNTTCAVATWIAPTATDNCTTTPSVTSNYTSGFCFPVGTTTVVYTATDAKNNSATCSFQVTVIGGACTTDVVKPVLSACPSNINLTTTKTCEVASWTPPTATDNCASAPSVTSNIASGFCFPVGTTTVVYTAKDDFNNTATCSFNVSVAAGTGTTDMGLTVSTINPSFSKWTTVNFKITVKNNGTTPFSNTKIEFKYPAGTVNGGSVVASLGLWEEWCAGGTQCFTWTIPTLATNAAATLDVPLFILDVATPITATAKLLSSSPVDNITTNNTGTVTITPNNALASVQQKPTQLIPVVIEKVSPSYTEGDVFVAVESLFGQEATFLFSDALGKVVKVDKRILEKGRNIIEFDVHNLPQGVYFVLPSNQSRNMPTKFIKL